MATFVSTVGVGLLLGAYAALASGRLSQGPLYFGMNIAGSLLAAVGSLLIGFVPFLVLEAAWAGIACKGLYSATRSPESATPS